MATALNLIKKTKETKDYEIRVGEKSLPEAMKIIRNLLSEPSIQTQEEIIKTNELEKCCMGGCRDSRRALKEKIIDFLKKYEIIVPDMTPDDVAEHICRYTWGLGPIEEIYNDPTVDEVQIIGTDIVYSIRRGIYTKENITFPSQEDLFQLIKRLIRSTRGDLTERNPIIRTVRAFDGSRVTITGPPVTKKYTVSIRKHGTFLISRENLIKNGTMDGLTYDKLALSSRGRLNILISGPVNSGKTTLIRELFGHGKPELRAVVIEVDSELRLLEHYPGWNIIELEEQKGIGISMDTLFETTLQISPVRIIFGEILGITELRGAIKSGIRGQTGNFSTYHSRDIRQALYNMALTYAEESRSSVMTIEMALRWVIQAFDIIIQMYTDPERGVKKVEHIAEPYIDEKGNLQLNDIVVWHGSQDDYCKGHWEHYPITASIKNKLQRNGIPIKEIEAVECSN
ncbi:ATPase, T2SS/T4P/T4SS family [Desulfoscipio geothermicus]|uniref:Pilus assembly protein CpaF n=1 Tax=Desulfoscipio geothermicus DSM 3669 TaxID=1121426 RepID=A0A1I6E4B3_9FIRM|nr:ATPase, T2SS/T4P/T4SS family [Desulfoscipio geothermicus]SFR12614.1 pilus assembly protein CpaF [Desulfoscipio geothermicus DSM 3669]